MKKAKIIFRLVIFLFLTSGNLFAQTGNKELSEAKKENIKAGLENYIEHLNLTDEQKSSYEAITQKYQDQLRFVSQSEMSRIEKLKEFKRIQSDKDAELKDLFTDEQYNIHQEFKKARRDTLLENFSGYDKLNLNDLQKEQFSEITTRYRNQMKNLQNSSMSRIKKFREYRSIQGKKDKEMKSLLSKEQYKSYKEIQEEMKEKFMENRN